MAKIIQVLNTMISNQSRIENVIRSEEEYFFLYDKKYKWSIRKDDEEKYLVFFYPDKNKTLEDLKNNTDWQYYNDFVTYTTSDLKTVEAIETFRELYQIVSDKLYGIDEIFDDIINS